MIHRFLTASFCWVLVCSTSSSETHELSTLLGELQHAAITGNRDAALRCSAEIEKHHPESLKGAMLSGETLYRLGEVKLSVEAFDRVIRIDPTRKPYLWQRGLALYDSAEFALGCEQFEAHREVNPHDVENAAWHFLCVAGLEGIEQAKKKLLPAPGDTRPPMEEVYALYAGRGSIEQVYAAAEKHPKATSLGKYARFYAELYVGLWHQVNQRPQEAKEALQRSLKCGAEGYMVDSARVRLKLLSP